MNGWRLGLIGVLCWSVVAIGLPQRMQTFIQDHHEYDRAIAVIQPMVGQTVKGVVRFVQLGDGVRVSIMLSGLTPNARHGVHVHRYGDASDNKKGRRAGGHYNPDRHPHGLPPTLHRHAGSFGNVQANENGDATLQLFDQTITIAGRKNPVIGRSVVVHAGEDTGEQPAGNAGPRIGLGVIGITAPN